MAVASNNQEQEQEANYFAICLLMPKALVITELDKLLTAGETDEEIIVDRLARKFHVGIVRMTIRLRELGLLFAPK